MYGNQVVTAYVWQCGCSSICMVIMLLQHMFCCLVKVFKTISVEKVPVQKLEKRVKIVKCRIEYQADYMYVMGWRDCKYLL